MHRASRGALEPGDRVIKVRKLEPTLLGSSLYRPTENKFPVIIEDARYALTTTDLAVDEIAQAQVRRNPSREVRQETAVVQPLVGWFGPSKSYRLSSKAGDTILESTPWRLIGGMRSNWRWAALTLTTPGASEVSIGHR